METNVDYAVEKMRKIIKSWGWNQEEYRYLLECLVPSVLFMACAYAIENFVYEQESEAEDYEKRRISKCCARIRKQRERVVAMGLRGVFQERSLFQFRGLDTAKFTRNGNLRIYLNKAKYSPNEPDPNIVVIPAGVLLRVTDSPFLSDRDKQVLELAKYKSEVALSLHASPRKYWPEKSSE